MQNAFGVGRGKSGAKVARDVERFVGRKPSDAAQQGSEVLAIDILHGEKCLSVDLAYVIYAANIGMGNAPRHSHFVTKTFDQPLIAGGFVGKKFQSYGLAERQIVCAVYLSHAAFAQQSDDAVARCDQPSGKESAFVQQIFGGTGDRDEEEDDDPGFGRGGKGEVAVAKSSVAKSSVFETGRPQEEQKRALLAKSVPQLEHLAMKNSRYSLNQAWGFGGPVSGSVRGRKRLTPKVRRSPKAESRRPLSVLPSKAMTSRLGLKLRDPLFLLCLAAGLLAFVVQSGELGTADTMHRLQTAHWLWTSQPQVFPNEYPEFGLPGRGGRIFSWYGIGQSLLMLPADLVGTWIAHWQIFSEYEDDPAVRSIVVSYSTNILINVLTALIAFACCASCASA